MISSLKNAVKFPIRTRAYNNPVRTTKKPLVIAGPSGVGKGTIINYIMRDYPGQFCYNVSHTSRAPRVGEVDGISYHFTTKDYIKKGWEEGNFVEVVEYNGELYGTSIKSIEDSQATGKIGIVEIDVQGCKILKKSEIDALYIFFTAPSLEVLESRLKGRRSESKESLRRRLETAQEEMKIATSSNIFDYILTNYESKETIKTVRRILERHYELKSH